MLIYIHMLTKRTNILFDEDIWKELVALAERQNTSVGELIRNAVKKHYMEEGKTEQIRKAVDSIHRFRNTFGKRLARGEDSTLLLRKMREGRYGKDYRQGI